MNLFDLYFVNDKPPVLNGTRHSGASHRSAFWLGYDGENPGFIPRGTNVHHAYRAGKAYAAAVKKGERVEIGGASHA